MTVPRRRWSISQHALFWGVMATGCALVVWRTIDHARETSKAQRQDTIQETEEPVQSEGLVNVRFPILDIPRDSGDDALLGYSMTQDERALFQAMDRAAASLPQDASLEQYHSVVESIGLKQGLDRKQSIAFWTRTTFSLFEPEGP